MVRLSAQWLRVGHEVSFVVTSAKGPIAHQLDPGVRVIDLKAHRTIAAFPKLLSWLSRTRPPLLVSVLTICNITTWMARRMTLANSCHVALVRNFTTEEVNGVSPLERAWLRPLLRRALRDADIIGCVSDDVRSDILKFANLNPAKVTTTYNPILPAINHDPNVATDRWRTGRRRLLSIGRLVPQKDHRSLLDAVSRIRHDFPVDLVILGEGPLRPELERQIDELQLSDIVSLRGYYSHPESYLEAADALILSSRFEGFPNVVGEALAFGCNVVATDSPGGVRELLDNGRYGFLCKVGDPDSLASAIRLALQQPKARDELVRRARMFTIEKVAQDYIDLFNNAHANWKNREFRAH